MSKLHHLGAYYADTLTLDKRRVKFITFADLAVNATTHPLLVYAQNIIAVTRASMGLGTKALKSITA
jgi:hypothetical protein